MSKLRFTIALSLDGFVALGEDLHGLKLVRTVAGPNVIHLKFAR
jgi:hypothetical protein